ncbi:MAG: hypothetical protein AAF790_00815 [Planctomycetota bacterium]
MSRPLALTLCLAAAAVGMGPGLGAALIAGDAERSAAVAEGTGEAAGPAAPHQQTRTPAPADSGESFLRRWLRRAAEHTPPPEHGTTPRLLPAPSPTPEPAPEPASPSDQPAPAVDAEPDAGRAAGEPPALVAPSAGEESAGLTAVPEAEALPPPSEAESLPPQAEAQPLQAEALPPVQKIVPPPLPMPGELDTPVDAADEGADRGPPAEDTLPLFAAPPATAEEVPRRELFEPPSDAIDPSGDAPDQRGDPVAFPSLPPDPYAEEHATLPPLCVELDHHGGSFLYTPEGDGWHEYWAEHQAKELGGHGGGHGKHDEQGGHHHAEPPKRLPEWFQAPQPCTRFPGLPTTEYLGADPIQLSGQAWPTPLSRTTWGGYQWEPRFVAAGVYDVFGIAFREGGVRQDGLGHNLTLDADLRLTGTERLHLQHRPIGEDGSGGSFYQFNDVDAYQDNSTAEPARIWLEGEVASVLSGWLHNPTQAWDMNFAVGKFPLALHNSLLINDEVAGVIVGNNNLPLTLPGVGAASNLNARAFWLLDDVNSLAPGGGEFGGGAPGDGGLEGEVLRGDVLGADAWIDLRHAFLEATYAYRRAGASAVEGHYLALSGTRFFGTATATARVMAKIAGPSGADGQLLVLEWNTHRRFDAGLLPRAGVRHAVAYANAFYATRGWSPIAGANFNRIRTSFEVNPLVQIARGDRDDTPGLALGVQLFGRGDDSSLTPELAWEAPSGVSIFGAGMRYQRRTGPGSFLELRGLINASRHSPFQRDGVFTSHHWFF